MLDRRIITPGPPSSLEIVPFLDSSSGTAARTRVLIESSDGLSEWGTVGVNDNIVEASLQALVDSLEYVLLRGKVAGATA